MNKRKAGGLSAAVLAILFVLYNLFVFLICKPSTGIFWMSYAFMLVAFASQVGIAMLAVKTLDVTAVFFGIPLIQLSIFYFFAELFASSVFMFFQDYVGFKIPLLIQITLLAIFAIASLMALGARDATKEIKDRVQEQSAGIKMLSVDMQTLAEEVSDAALKSRMKKLAENIRYSDPVSTKAIADVDMRIHQAFIELRVSCEEKDIATATDLCSRLDYMVVERNKKLMLSK